MGEGLSHIPEFLCLKNLSKPLFYTTYLLPSKRIVYKPTITQ